MIFDLAFPDRSHPRARWRGLHGAALPLALAESAASLDGPLVVFTQDALQLERLESELAFFVHQGLPVLAFPDYETLPYDRFSPHPDIISQRLRTLARLPMLERGIVLADLPTALQRLPPRSFIDAHTLALATGEELDLDAFRLRLTAAGYASVPQVGTPGDFAIRGSLFDLFPMGSDAPLRIDLNRPADRQHPKLRFRHPAYDRTARARRVAASTRVQPRGRVDPGFPSTLPHTFRGRSHQDAPVSRRRRRSRARRHRVLPAALLRVHLDTVRLSARRRLDRTALRHGSHTCRGAASDRRTPRGAPLRHRAPRARARRDLYRAPGMAVTRAGPSACGAGHDRCAGCRGRCDGVDRGGQRRAGPATRHASRGQHPGVRRHAARQSIACAARRRVPGSP